MSVVGALKLSHTILPGESKVPPVFVLHGLMGNKQNFRYVSNQLNSRTRRQIITLDFRNHGDSPWSPEMSMRSLAGDTVQLALDLGHETFSLLGHSMGGRVAMEIALSHPGVVERVCIVDVAPAVRPRDGHSRPKVDVRSGVFRVLESIREFKPRNTDSLSKNREYLNEFMKSGKYPIQDEAVRQLAKINLIKRSSGDIGWRFNIEAAMSNWNDIIYQTDAGTFTKATLFVGGRNSPFMTHRDSQRDIRKLFPDADIQLIPGAGHFVHADRPAEFLDIVSPFFQ